MLWTVFATLVAVVVVLLPRGDSAISGSFDNPGFKEDRTTIVEMFEWTWADVARECVDFLGPHGYGAVQVSPPSENAVQLYTTPGGDKVRSWYERYEPVSYQISSPSGDLNDFEEMVRECEKANVRKTKGSELRDLKQDVLHWSSRDVLYVDNHETQRGVDVSDPKQDVVSYQDRRNHVLANILMLAMPQGIPRVMSSYALNVDVQPYVPPKKLGPPSDHAFNTRPVLMKEDYTCYNGWICEHRWLPIRNMVKFRNVVASAPVTNWWDDSEDAVAFARLRKGFVLINNGRSTVTGLFNTTLPQGYYCDVLSGSSVDRRSCTGNVVRVREDGFAELAVEGVGDVPAVAIQADVS
ncbi:alpha-amylase, putative [Ixodes scapularis]|uniref:alpha-amylase n=1 Tax=Ixodes scapularis TaxID=6945 RepID=B7QMB4_IXOSC|nr:alpha-amylase, putative [Ixodes scapularis]|eukprot:XP_002416319.1 alpha-amylase, putative [Ixodes scapularis]